MVGEFIFRCGVLSLNFCGNIAIMLFREVYLDSTNGCGHFDLN